MLNSDTFHLLPNLTQFCTVAEWVTPELMQQFAQNPVLARGLNDPRMQQMIAALQKNPKAAMEAVKNDPEAEAFMNEFCKTVGGHFTDLGTQQNQPNNVNAPPPSAGPLADETVKRLGTKDKSPPAAPTPEEDAQVQNVLQNENLRNLLMDQELVRTGYVGYPYLNQPLLGS